MTAVGCHVAQDWDDDRKARLVRNREENSPCTLENACGQNLFKLLGVDLQVGPNVLRVMKTIGQEIQFCINGVRYRLEERWRTAVNDKIPARLSRTSAGCIVEISMATMPLAQVDEASIDQALQGIVGAQSRRESVIPVELPVRVPGANPFKPCWRNDCARFRIERQ